jgi:hypothetical protein
MSTRCQIAFYEKESQKLKKPTALIYRHSDGYPEGVKPELDEFLPKFLKQRGNNDIEYLSAQFLASMIKNMHDWSDTLDEDSKNTWSFIGYGICGDRKFHGDIEFLYALKPVKGSKTKMIVEVHEPIHDEKYEIVDFKLTDTWNFEAEK